MLKKTLGLVVVVACSDPAALPPPGDESIQITGECSIPPVPAASTVQTSIDVPVYSPQGQTQLLDLVAPLGAQRRPLVVFVHGGAWRAGNHHEFLPEMGQLASLGYVAASVGYRLAPTYRFPSQIEDVRCAVRFLRENSQAFGIDGQRVALVGASAGGHLAGLVAFGPTVSEFDGQCPYSNQPLTVRGFVSYYAPLDLQEPGDFPLAIQSAIADLFGGTPTPAMSRIASPISHIASSNPPTLVIQGAADDLISPSQARRVRAALGVAGVPATLVELPAVGHGFRVFAPDAALRSASCTTLKFLEKYLSPQS